VDVLRTIIISDTAEDHANAPASGFLSHLAQVIFCSTLLSAETVPKDLIVLTQLITKGSEGVNWVGASDTGYWPVLIYDRHNQAVGNSNPCTGLDRP
jgi:hypothetical protein